jgi:two-component system CheB/CheR fusion protein
MTKGREPRPPDGGAPANGRGPPASGGAHEDRLAELAHDNAELRRQLKGVERECQHRVRNLLGLVRSVVRRSVQGATEIDDLTAHLDGRLATLARTQAILLRTADATFNLEEVLRDELIVAAVRPEQLSIHGPAVSLGGEEAQTFALALYELVTNAVKYGALAEPNGSLDVRWERRCTAEGERLRLDWKESGVRAVDTQPSHFGFGRELLEKALPYELGASVTLAFRPGGMTATIDMPLGDYATLVGDGAPFAD